MNDCCQIDKNQWRVEFLNDMGLDFTHVVCIICEKEWVE